MRILIVDDDRQITREIMAALRHLEPAPALVCYPPMSVIGEPDFSLASEIMPNFPMMLPERTKQDIPMMSIHRFDLGADPIQEWVSEVTAGPTGHPTRHRKQWKIKRESRRRNRCK